MKALFIICLSFITLNVFSQSTYYKHYFDTNSEIASDTFNIKFKTTASSDQYALFDSFVVKHIRIESIDKPSQKQEVFAQKITPINCSYIASETLDEYNNTIQEIKLTNFTGVEFGVEIEYEVANKTVFASFNDCPYNYNQLQNLSAFHQQYMVAEDDIQSTDDAIKTLSDQLTANATTIAEMVEAIVLYVRNNIVYDLSSGQDNQDALSVLASKKAICTGYSNLTCALLRHKGIPARLATGHLINSDPFKYEYEGVISTMTSGYGPHAWVEVYYPSQAIWIPSEPQTTANFITPNYLTIGNTNNSTEYASLYADNTFFGNFSLQMIECTQDTMIATNPILTRHEPITTAGSYGAYLCLEIGKDENCNSATDAEQLLTSANSVYPTIIENSITAVSNNTEEKTISIYNNLGIQVFQTATSNIKTEIDTKKFPKGIYFITIQSKSASQTFTCIK